MLKKLGQIGIHRFVNFVFGGSAFTLAVAHRWGWAAVALVAFLVSALEPWQPLINLYSIRQGGLQLTIPLEPLDGSQHREAKRRRYLAAATTAIETAFNNSNTVDLLLCSGFQVIGTDTHPGWIHGLLRQVSPTAQIRVLMLDPDCAASQARGTRYMDQNGANAYKEGVKDVTHTLANFVTTRGLNLAVKYYEDEPIWQVLVFPREVFVMLASARPTDRSPIWVFRREGEYSVARGFIDSFERRWDDDPTNVDLTQTAAGDPTRIVNLLRDPT